MAIKLIDTVKPKGSFPIAEAVDVDVNGEKLTEVLEKKADKAALQSLSGVVDTKASKSEVTALAQSIETKADKTSVYNKTEIDRQLSEKANKSDIEENGLVVKNGMLCIKFKEA